MIATRLDAITTNEYPAYFIAEAARISNVI
jgi:hypothetical protein